MTYLTHLPSLAEGGEDGDRMCGGRHGHGTNYSNDGRQVFYWED